MDSADVLIIGGGIIGCSIAYHLAKRGAGKIIVLDAAVRPGMGSTGAATGGFRVQFSSTANIQLSLLSRQKLLSFRDETGVDPEYKPAGYLFLASSGSQLEGLRSAMRVQHVAGATETREVTPRDAAELNPAANLEGIIGGSYGPKDGFMRPLQILQGYRSAAERMGVQFRYGSALIGFGFEGKRVITAETNLETISAGIFINAAGAWAEQVAARAGIELPVVPIPRHVAVTQPTSVLGPNMPMTVFAEDGFHLRVRDGRVLMIWTTAQLPPPSFSTRVDASWIEHVYTRALKAIPALKQTTLDVKNSWAGLYEMSPDKSSILGKAAEWDNFYLANGSSGHGVMHSPAIGQLIAEAVVDGHAHSVDISPLSPERFKNQAQIRVHDIL